ncbi:MAG: ATP-binding protein [Thermoproteota archaeon]
MTQCEFGFDVDGFLTSRGIRTCRQHFIQYFENKVFATARRFKMIRPNSKVLIAFSGGKDSTSLLYSLCSLREMLDIVEILAVSVDEGLPHRVAGLSNAEKFCSGLKVPWRKISFRELYDITIDQVFSIRRTSKKTCTYCGVLRRRALELIALDEGCDVILTGHNFEDFCQTYLMNIIRNEQPRLYRSGPATDEMEGFVPRCSPLAKIRSFETTEYVRAIGAMIHKTPCPHKVGAFRLEVMNLIEDLSKVLPDFQQNLTRAVERQLYFKTETPRYQLNRCVVCGFPSSEDKCRPCSVLEELRSAVKEH